MTTKLNFEAAQEMHQQGRFKEAGIAYLALLRKTPHDVAVLHALAVLSAQQDDFSAATDYLQRAVNFQPNNVTLQLHLANMLKFQGLFQQAAERLEKTIAKNPDYAPAYNNLGTIYYSQAKLTDAENVYRKALKLQPDYIDALYNLGLALTKQNKIVDAMQTYERLLSKSPEHTAARFQLACLQMQTEKIDEAIAAFLQVDSIQAYHFETQANLAACYLKKGDPQQAKLYYAKALDTRSEDTQILFNLGVIEAQLGELNTAIQHYQRALITAPDDFAVHNNLGVTFLARQNAAFALRHFKEALRIQPENVAIAHIIEVLSTHNDLSFSPPEYIKSLFDSYADHYEAHLLHALDYQLPALFLKILQETINLTPSSRAILDLGCGTGLCGALLKPFANKLVGVDLSEKMLEVAAKKNIYDALTTADLTTYLSTHTERFDIITAGDVFVYIGDLATIFTLIKNRLNKKGVFIFNLEMTQDADFKVNQSGRFLHRKDYIEKLAQENELQISHYQQVITRMQNNAPVFGHCWVLCNAD